MSQGDLRVPVLESLHEKPDETQYEGTHVCLSTDLTQRDKEKPEIYISNKEEGNEIGINLSLFTIINLNETSIKHFNPVQAK